MEPSVQAVLERIEDRGRGLGAAELGVRAEVAFPLDPHPPTEPSDPSAPAED
jgi:hypothetical protein